MIGQAILIFGLALAYTLWMGGLTLTWIWAVKERNTLEDRDIMTAIMVFMLWVGTLILTGAVLSTWGI